ncbi:regulatory LuxR family protein [Brevibacterium sanguinis]|uniref:Regulatory LuxR family protein n=2 Tax=Brevibacterium TaxID=1696 RepID=A0A366IMW8_9MICO|nr:MULTISPECIES: LuxR family transcriptional regulator [Brevibacterium]RBP66980.1 regulatory LuxR family protein [Brevibacterium sanguinis]RBP73505.1 regulatory LuxR family protein [Brevibacterium celere]
MTDNGHEDRVLGLPEELHALVGRAEEVRAVESALSSPLASGIVIEGEIGIGKTLLAREIHRRRGARDLWVCGDRVHSRVPFGAFGLLVDLDGDSSTLLSRIVTALTEAEPEPVVFVDDAQHLDEDSVRVLSQLAIDRAIRLVVIVRRSTVGERTPFVDLVDEQVLEHIVLEVLEPAPFRALMEDFLGGIAAQGAVDIVRFHSGGNPGKMLELLRYTRRKNRFLHRQGVWLLDGLDVDYDDRARDFTRVDLTQYSEEEKEALELVVLAGEIDVELMLSAGLGRAADALVAVGELRIEERGSRVYVAMENHASETIRHTVPLGRSRQKYELVANHQDSPSEYARILRAEWALGCGARLDEQSLIDAARIAYRHGEWHRALRLLAEIPTDRMAAHELFDLARLYCDSGKPPLGLDVLAQCVEKACCPGVVVESLVIWMNLDPGFNSPAISIEDFYRALERLRTAEDAPPVSTCTGGDIDVDTAWTLFPRVAALFSDPPGDQERLLEEIFDTSLPETFRVLAALRHASDRLNAGRGGEAFEALSFTRSTYRSLGTGMLLLKMMQVRILVQEGRLDEAKARLRALPTHDIAYLAARSGPSDLLWAQVHLFEGRLPEAARALRAGVEALGYWHQNPLLAVALGTIEHISMIRGEIDAADDYHARAEQLPRTGLFLEQERARILGLVARAMRTADPRYENELREMLAAAEHDGAHGVAALITLLLFRHFDAVDPERMCRLAPLGTDYEFRLLRKLGPALRDRDGDALLDFVTAFGASMPDLAAKCRAMAKGFHSGGRGEARPSEWLRTADQLTNRERQISSLIVSGKSNAEIAEELGVALRTVEGHTYRLYRKLGITRRHEVAEAVARLEAQVDGGPRPATDRVE